MNKLKIICIENNVKEKAAQQLKYAKTTGECVIDDLEVIDELLFNSPPELEIEIELGNGKICNRERAKVMRAEHGWDLR